MRAFIEMRKFLSKNANIFNKFQQIDQKLIKQDNDIEKLFKALELEKLPKQGIFFDGQVFEAYKFITELIKTAKKEIILYDNYIDFSTLLLFSNTKAKVKIYTKINDILELDFKKYNQKYNNIELINFTRSHDRFLIIDKQVYHIGASLKDLGKKWFAFSKFETNPFLLL